MIFVLFLISMFAIKLAKQIEDLTIIDEAANLAGREVVFYQA